jgi:hypothetical protein
MNDAGKALHELQTDPEFKNLIPPSSSGELRQLEENIQHDGCLDALTVWNGVIVDGHNRYEICKRLNIVFAVSEMHFDTRDDAKEWIIKNQFGRRNLPNYERARLALKLEPLLAKKARERMLSGVSQHNPPQNSAEGSDTRDEVAKLAGVSHDTIDKVKKIEAKATEETKRKLQSREMTVNRAYTETFVNQKPATKICTTCGRTLAIEKFYESKGRYSSRCRQCEQHHKNGGTKEDVLKSIGIISEGTAKMYDTDAVIEYTVDDVIDEIERGAAAFKRLILNAIEMHSEPFREQHNRRKLISTLADAIAEIEEIRRAKTW